MAKSKITKKTIMLLAVITDKLRERFGIPANEDVIVDLSPLIIVGEQIFCPIPYRQDFIQLLKEDKKNEKLLSLILEDIKEY